MRLSKHQHYINIANEVSKRGTCLRRNYGSVIVKDDRIVSTGYCGAPRGEPNCVDIGKCIRKELNIPRGERYESCKSVHSEANSIIFASYNDLIGSTLYISGNDYEAGERLYDTPPCMMCKRLIINAQIKYVIYEINKDEFNIYEPNDLPDYNKKEEVLITKNMNMDECWFCDGMGSVFIEVFGTMENFALCPYCNGTGKN